jgi:hypothetical protein
MGKIVTIKHEWAKYQQPGGDEDSSQAIRAAPLLQALTELENYRTLLSPYRIMEFTVLHKAHEIQVTIKTCADGRGGRRGEVYRETAPKRSLTIHIAGNEAYAESEHLLRLKPKFNIAGLSFGALQARPDRISLPDVRAITTLMKEWLNLAAPFVRNDLVKAGQSLPFGCPVVSEILQVKDVVNTPRQTVKYRSNAPDTKFVLQ